MTWKGNVPERGGDGNDDGEVGFAAVEGIDGDNEDGAFASLLVAAHRIEIGEPNVTARRAGSVHGCESASPSPKVPSRLRSSDW